MAKDKPRKNFKGQLNGVGFIWIIFIVAIGLWISAFIVFTILPLLPHSSDSIANQGLVALTNYEKYAFSFIDNSFYVLIVIIIFIGLFASYEHPSRGKAIADFIAILFLGYFNLVISGILPALNVFSPAVYLPITYTFFNSAYKATLLYFALIISILLNLRSNK